MACVIPDDKSIACREKDSWRDERIDSEGARKLQSSVFDCDIPDAPKLVLKYISNIFSVFCAAYFVELMREWLLYKY